MTQKLSNPRGTADILPDQVPAWEQLETTARNLLKTYGYREIRTPIFEEVGLFKRSLGETAEVVNKQLLEVRGQRSEVRGEEEKETSFALRPEGTAPVVRAYNQNSLERQEGLSKLFYIASMFRGERPQKGRLRQFHQIGAEAIGYMAKSEYLDAEMIALAVRLLKSFGVEGFTLKINSLGFAEDKKHFAEWLREVLKDKIGHLSDECKNQYERNVFRLLDSKDKDCRAVINGLDIGSRHLSKGGQEYFDNVRRLLDKLGVAYEVSNQLVRGLDYYTHTVFEITSEGLGAQDAIGAGGRYNGLIEQLGGGDRRMEGEVGAVGFALGMERILLALEAQGKTAEGKGAIDVFVVKDDKYQDEAFLLLDALRQNGIAADMFFGPKAFKQQFVRANQLNAKYVLILAEEEARNQTVGIKDMQRGDQETVPTGKVVEELRKRLHSGS